MFVTGAGFGTGFLTSGEALLAALVSVMLGFLPVATLFQELGQFKRKTPNA